MRRTVWPIVMMALATPLAARGEAVVEREAGVTAASNPAVEGVPPVSNRRELVVGLSVFERERVISAPDGQAQLLFRDGSSFTIGPSSDLVLDEFLYDAEAGKGHLAISLGKGLFRFVGGKLSKDGSVALTTPSAVLGVRGGIALIEVSESGATTATLLHGDELTVTARTGEVARVQRSGFFVTVPSPGAAPSPPARLPAEKLGNGFAQLRGQPQRSGGLTQRPPAPTVVAALRAPVTLGRPAASGSVTAPGRAGVAAPGRAGVVASPFASHDGAAAVHGTAHPIHVVTLRPALPQVRGAIRSGAQARLKQRVMAPHH